MADPLEERLRTALAEQYRVERKIGDGGMAAVYLAEELEPRRQVAIKVLKPEVAAVLGHERFLAEIEIASRLNHSYILALLHSGVVDGQSYYVMPYEQESLRDRLKRQQQLPIEDAIRIAREVSEALEHAHRQEVVHRDIKPENIMFKGEHVAVADFGIASAAWALGGKKLTGTGVTLGTSAYMSPEQTLAEELDGRSDVYSLGCVLYEMLAGQAPYTGPNAMTVEAQHRSSPIPDVTQLRPSVPEGILGALQKSLAKNRADRFESASGFAAALERGASEQSSVTPPSP